MSEQDSSRQDARSTEAPGSKMKTLSEIIAEHEAHRALMAVRRRRRHRAPQVASPVTVASGSVEPIVLTGSVTFEGSSMQELLSLDEQRWRRQRKTTYRQNRQVSQDAPNHQQHDRLIGLPQPIQEVNVSEVATIMNGTAVSISHHCGNFVTWATNHDEARLLEMHRRNKIDLDYSRDFMSTSEADEVVKNLRNIPGEKTIKLAFTISKVMASDSQAMAEAFAQLGDLRQKAPGNLTTQSAMLRKFPAQYTVEDYLIGKPILDPGCAMRIDATVVVLRHLYAQLPHRLRGDPQVGSSDVRDMMADQEKQSVLLRVIWADFELLDGHPEHNHAAHHAIRQQIVADHVGNDRNLIRKLSSEGLNNITLTKLLFSKNMWATLWKRPGFAFWEDGQEPARDPWTDDWKFLAFVRWYGEEDLALHIARGVNPVRQAFRAPRILVVLYHCQVARRRTELLSISLKLSGDFEARTYILVAAVLTSAPEHGDLVDYVQLWDQNGAAVPYPEHAKAYCEFGDRAPVGQGLGETYLLFYSRVN